MKIRVEFVSNSSSCSFIVDAETNSKYFENYLPPDIEGIPVECNGRQCVEYWGADDECHAEGYDNDEEYLSLLYDNMCTLSPKFIEWKNHH